MQVSLILTHHRLQLLLSRINVVKNKHIYRGIKRFSTALTEIVDSPHLPAPAELADAISQIEKLPLEQLRKRILVYRKALKKRYGQPRPQSAKWPADIFDDHSHWEQLSKEEMQSLLMVEYMKDVLRKTNSKDVGLLLNPAE